MLIKKVTGARNLTKLQNRKIEYIVVHYTAGVTSRKGSAVNTAHWFMNPQCQGSADYIVDDEEIVQYNADVENYYTWHCGGVKYNNKGGKMMGKVLNSNSIGIELCSNNKLKKMMTGNHESYYFTPETLKKAEELIKHLMNKYNIPVSHIVRHYDCTGKLCPGVIGWNADSGSEKEWKKFKVRFEGHNSASGEAKKDKSKKSALPPFKLFKKAKSKPQSNLVKVTANVLNVRKEPNVTAATVGGIRKGEVYTIIEEKNGWGKLKSGAGWINLYHTRRI